MDKKIFHVYLIRPSHYDDDGYVIQWHRSIVPSNTLAALYGLSRDLLERNILGEDVKIELNAMDESNTQIPVKKIIHAISENSGLVIFAGVQTNQFPRTMDLASQLRQAGIQVCIGGFHVSGCISMLQGMPSELQDALDLGISLFAGECEGRLDKVFKDAYQGEMPPIYNYLNDLPTLQSHPTPFLPANLIQRSIGSLSSFDAGRGCPFVCSFCTIINVQGRQSRFRSADEIEHIVRENSGQGVFRFLITDDNFARNRDWENIFDRIIELRQKENIKVRLLLQVDTMCHRIPNFIEKAELAGVASVFIGLESVNPANLVTTGKRQNKIAEYRKTLQAWQNAKVITSAGYIIGFDADTPQSIASDFKLIQRELPLHSIQLSYLTPLPGSEDHRKLHESGVWMDPDINKYDLHHITTKHPTMSESELEDSFNKALGIFYSDEQVNIRLKRAMVSGISLRRMSTVALWYHACKLEGVSGPDGGFFRRKFRRDRRPGMPIENPFTFYLKRIWEIVYTYSILTFIFLKYQQMCRSIKADSNAMAYSDESFPTPNELAAGKQKV